MMRYYDKDGSPLSRLECWAKKLEDPGYRRVAETTLLGGAWVSTVWMGVDHQFIPGGPPLIFETMIFAEQGNPYDGFQVRYSTLEQAQAGHERIVARLKEGVDPEELYDL